MSEPEVRFSRDRVTALLKALEAIAAGERKGQLPISPLHDELDALSFAVNVLADELRFAYARLMEIERARAEAHAQSVRSSVENFDAIFHSNPCGMTIRRLSDGRYLDVNESFERHTEYSRGEILGRTRDEFPLWVHPDDLAAIELEIRTGGRSRNRELRYRSRSGAPRTAIYSTEFIVFRGERCLLAVGLDITDSRNAEVQAATLREELAHLARVATLDALAGSIAHEINQPLTAIITNAETVLHSVRKGQTLPHDVGPVLRDIVTDGRRAADVIEQLRALLHKEQAQVETLQLNSVVRDVVRLIEGDAVRREVTLDVVLHPDAGIVAGYRVQVQQVAINLLMNAFDAVETRPPGDRRVALRTAAINGDAVLSVCDAGDGAPDEVLAQMFLPFYSTKPNGMGLGLSICQTIVAAHGGTLQATRNAGPGLTVAATFPTHRQG